VGKHEDQEREKEEEKRRGNGQVSSGTVISPKEPEGKHSASDPEPEDDKE